MANRSQLRITAWPSAPVPVPKIDVSTDVRVRGDRLYFGGDPSKPRERRQPPDQLYLFELADLDLSDVEAVAELCRTLGPIAPLRRTDLPALASGGWRRELLVHSTQYGRAWEPASGENENFIGIEPHVDELTYRVRVVRQLTRHLQAHAAGASVAAAWPDCEDDYEAWTRFSRFSDAALSPFRVRIMVDVGDPDFNVGEPNPGLYSIAVLQMFNDFVDQVDFRRCAAEKCGRTFVRQRGRGQSYSRTIGVLYCSASCANAQAQREWRRKQREKRRNGEPK
jgi:hypothetical protein